MVTFGRLREETSGRGLSFETNYLISRVAECALEKSGAALRISRVEEVKPESHGGFIVRCLSLKWSRIHGAFFLRHTELKRDATGKVLRKEGGFEREEIHQGSCVECMDEHFDVVVVAAPQTKDKTKLAGVREGYYLLLVWFQFSNQAVKEKYNQADDQSHIGLILHPWT